LKLWRIATDTPTYVADDLSGRGAELTGGRWNAKGVPLLYASVSRALACLETLVHLDGGMPLPLNRYLVELTVPEDSWRARGVFEPKRHVGWDATPAGKVSIDWGTAWAAARTSLCAEVPSIVVPEEANVLVNPAHPDIARVVVVKRRKWAFDARLA
jgi:RES domain-containing protein